MCCTSSVIAYPCRVLQSDGTQRTDGADVVVLTALELEYAAVRRQLTDVVARRSRIGTIFESGRVHSGSGRVAAAVIGPGNLGAAVLADQAIAMFRPRALVFVGVAGALHSDLALGDVIVATR